MEYDYASFDIGMSFFDKKRYDIIGSGLKRVLDDMDLEDMKVVCRKTISKDEFMPEKERFQVIIGKKSADWEKILKEN